MIGERILNYQINSLLGEGGIGKVYLATHTQLERKVAVKALNEHLVNNEEIRERFRQEAATLSNLQHLNIVTLYDYVEDERGLFLIMEYAEGQPLDEYIQNISGPIPEEKAIPIFAKILEGLNYAHQQGIVHRDIKPSNIIVNPPEKVKILDFGIAKILNADKNHTKTGTALGTVLYMSPEQVEGKILDHCSDIYSLGVTLFEMLTGKAPYPKNAPSEFEIYQKILQEPLPRVKEIYPAISDRMQLVIDKATAKSPEKRFKNCEEFRKALIGELTLRAVPKKTSPEEPKPITETNPNLVKTQIATSPEPQKKRRFPVIYLVIALLFVTIGVLSWRVFFSDNNENTNNDLSNIDTTAINQEEERKPDFIDDTDKPEEEKEKTPEELALDSLNKEKKSREEKLKAYYDGQKEKLKNNLIIDGQFVSNDLGLFTVQVNVINKSPSVKFDNLTILIDYTDDNGQKVDSLTKFYGSVKPEHNESFTVEKETSASKFTCSYRTNDLEMTDLDPESRPASLDSLQKEVEEIEEAIEEIKEKQKEAREKEQEARKEEEE